MSYPGIFRISACLLLTLFCTVVMASDEKQVSNLDELLEQVVRQQQDQRRLNAEREARFIADKQQQQALLREARADFEANQRKNQPLIQATEANAQTLSDLQAELAEQVQDLGDLAAVFREFSGDFAAVLGDSPVTAQFPERAERLQALAERDRQPGIGEIESLWLLLQADMTAAAKVARYQADVVSADGIAQAREVIRIGTFTSIDSKGFLRYIPETGELLALSRQPAARYVADVEDFFQQQGQLGIAVVDPTRGNLLGLMGYSPTLGERIEQGGVIAQIILALGALGILLTFWRSAVLLWIGRGVDRQRGNVASPDAGNPLGRVLQAAEQAGDEDEDLLQLKLDEAILVEIPALERGTSLIKLLAAIAPLLGLLGTVTGMIITFQAISLFGTGDPKLMAGGISQALVTTVLGLVTAIPLLFGHSLVSTLSRAIVQQLDEQSAGILARRQEEDGLP